jgi:hypothetical protein
MHQQAQVQDNHLMCQGWQEKTEQELRLVVIWHSN